MSQTSYTTEPLEAFPGMLGDSHETDALSLSNGEASAVAFGIAVKLGATENKFAKMTASATVLGVLAHKHREASLTTTAGVDVEEVADVVSKGSIWVRVEENVAVGDAVFVVNSGANAGYFRNDVNGGAADALTGARWERGGTLANGYALLDLNLP